MLSGSILAPVLTPLVSVTNVQLEDAVNLSSPLHGPSLPPPPSASPSFAQALWAYLLRLTEAITSTARSAVPPPPPAPSAIAGMSDLLAALGDLITEIPPGPTTVGRYGNAAFREWHARASGVLPDLVRRVGVIDDADVAEVVDLLSVCWGNTTRLDYGSGHEAAFLVVLFVLSEKVRRGGGTGSRLLAAGPRMVSSHSLPSPSCFCTIFLLYGDETDVIFWHRANPRCLVDGTVWLVVRLLLGSTR